MAGAAAVVLQPARRGTRIRMDAPSDESTLESQHRYPTQCPRKR